MTSTAVHYLELSEESALLTAMAASVLFNVGAAGALPEDAIDRLLSLQLPDGDWRAEAFYCVDCRLSEPTYFGSREITTALVIEALSKYLQTNN